MKIMMITNDTNFAYNLRREILYRFVEEGHNVYLVGQVLNFLKEFSDKGIEVIDVQTERRGTNPLNDLKLYKTYKTILKDIKPDIVFTNNIKPNVYAGKACQELGIKYIPNITGLGTPVEKPGKLQKLTIQMYKKGVAGAATIFFQNRENLEFFKSHGMLNEKSKVVMLPGSGVNLETHPYMEYPDNGDINFLFVARIMKEKGIDIFLEVAKRIKATRDDVSFHICGMCDDENYLKILKDYENQGYIIYHGLQKDINPFYEKCSCFLYPSYYPEGMSNVLLEAAACGRPIIAVDRAGCRETVEDGISGYVVKKNDMNDILKVTKQFLSLSYEDKKNMGLNGRKKMQKEFNRKIVTDAYIAEL